MGALAGCAGGPSKRTRQEFETTAWPNSYARCLPVLGACAEPVAEAGDGQPGARGHPEHYGTYARMVGCSRRSGTDYRGRGGGGSADRWSSDCGAASFGYEKAETVESTKTGGESDEYPTRREQLPPFQEPFNALGEIFVCLDLALPNHQHVPSQLFEPGPVLAVAVPGAL